MAEQQFWLWGHSGGEAGVSTEMFIDPDQEIGIAGLSNGEGFLLSILDELYNYGLTLNSTGQGEPPCDFTLQLSDSPNTPFHLFPNPSHGPVHFEFLKPGKRTYCIYNATGQKVQSGQIDRQKESLFIPQKGLYWISIQENDRLQTHKVLIH